MWTTNQSQLDMLFTVSRTEHASLGYLSLIALFDQKAGSSLLGLLGVPGTSSPNVPAANTPATAVSCRSPLGQRAWAKIHWLDGCATNEGG